jgi:hypothetical protein
LFLGSAAMRMIELRLTILYEPRIFENAFANLRLSNSPPQRKNAQLLFDEFWSVKPPFTGSFDPHGQIQHVVEELDDNS